VAADGVVLGAAALLAVATGTSAALLPVLRLRRLGAATRELRAGGHGRGLRLRRSLAVVQLALAIVLGSGALLLLRSVAHLEAVDTGVRSRDVVMFPVSFSAGRCAAARDVERFFERLLPELEALPGVEAAAATLTPPVEGSWRNYLTIRGRELPERELPLAHYVVVSPGYFETLGIPLLAGRGFEPRDGAAGRHVAVLSRTAAEHHWPGQDPIGQRILGSSSGASRTGLDEGVGGEWAEVIGVVGDVRQSLTDAPQDQVYVPIAQERVPGMWVVLRLAEGAPVSAAAIEERVHGVDPDVPVGRLQAFEDRFARKTARPRLGGALISAFAAIALIAAVVGVYGVLLHSVAERRRELGVRAAIGASPVGLVWLVLREALGIAGVAALLGVAGSLAAGRLLESQLHGVAPGDPRTLALVLGLLGLATLAASLRPARYAAALDPAAVLREP
jgi:predicted permease